jgi:hypothetical protein
MRVRTFLALAILVREVFSFWTGHPYDFELWVRTGYWVARGVNPYGYIYPAPGLSFISNIGAGGNPTVAYLPFWPLLLGGLYKFYALLGSPGALVYYFILKQPIILCDVLLGYFLYRYLERRGSDKAVFVLKVWLFSPFNIILSGIWGMFDAIPMLFVVLALTARPGAYRGAWAGLATFAKSIPLIYTIPLSRGPKPLRNFALALGIPVVASLVVVWLTGWSFSVFGTTLQSTLGKGGLSLSLWEILTYLNSLGLISNSALVAYSSSGYVWIAGVGVATLLGYKWFGYDTERGVIQSMLLITLTFLLLRGQVNEQYFVYLFGLMLIDVAMWSPRRKGLFFLSLGLILMVTVTNDVLLLRFLSPVYPNALVIEGDVIAAINPERNVMLFLEAMSLCAVNVYYFYALYKERHARTGDAPLLP